VPKHARTSVSLASHEVLAEKTLHRVGFCVGFLALGGLPCN
jgi:hypothetical protein